MNVFDYEKVKDPLYFADGCVEAHSDHRYYGSVAELADGEERFKESLNGLWKFHYAKNYESTVQGFEKEEYCCLSWDDIRVPAHIQMDRRENFSGIRRQPVHSPFPRGPRTHHP